jgi:DNA invertase Pin-like site-specific DNA recombinase
LAYDDEVANRRRRSNTRPVGAPTRAIGYIRVSTDKQVESGASLQDQRDKLLERARREGWTICLTDTDEALSAKDTAERPALTAALETLDRGDADVLVAYKLDRLSRSVFDTAGLMKRAEANGWRLVVVDGDVDMTTADGRMMTHIRAVFAEREREAISQRTRDALAVKRAQGVRLGRPSRIPHDVVLRIVAAKQDGMSMAQIARVLTEDGVPTASGRAAWSKATIQSVLNGQDAASLATS